MNELQMAWENIKKAVGEFKGTAKDHMELGNNLNMLAQVLFPVPAQKPAEALPALAAVQEAPKEV